MSSSESENDNLLKLPKPILFDLVKSLHQKPAKICGLFYSHPDLWFIRLIFGWKTDKNGAIEKLMKVFVDASLEKYLKDTPVYSKIEDFCRNILSSKKRNKKLIDSEVQKTQKLRTANAKIFQIRSLVYKFLKNVKFDELVGLDNCWSVAIWSTNFALEKGGKTPNFPDFVHKSAPISKAFRAKSVGRKLGNSRDQVAVQHHVINTIRAVSVFVSLKILRKHLRRVRGCSKGIYFWRTAIRKVIRKDKQKLKKIYKIEPLTDEAVDDGFTERETRGPFCQHCDIR